MSIRGKQMRRIGCDRGRWRCCAAGVHVNAGDELAINGEAGLVTAALTADSQIALAETQAG